MRTTYCGLVKMCIRDRFDAVHGIALVQQQLGQVGTVLAGDAGDECGLGHGGVRSEQSLKISPPAGVSHAPPARCGFVGYSPPVDLSKTVV